MMMLIYEDVPVISCGIRIFERLDDDLQICLIMAKIIFATNGIDTIYDFIYNIEWEMEKIDNHDVI